MFVFGFCVFILAASNCIVSGSIGDQLAETTQLCCNQGTTYARSHSSEDCSSSIPPDVPSRLGTFCIFAMDQCCKDYFQKKRDCDSGIDIATSLSRCDNTQDLVKSCCEQCLSGAVDGKSRGAAGCEGIVRGDGADELLARDAHAHCCEKATKEETKDNTTQHNNVSSVTSYYENNGLASLCEDYAPNELCAHHCIPVPGSYRCQCNPGFMLMSDGRNCKEVVKNRCKPHNPCQHRCNDNGVEVKCSCRRGYQLQDDKKSCGDIDECLLDPPVCMAGTDCRNIQGSYKCIPQRNYHKPSQDLGQCPPGFARNFRSNVCDDINECELSRPPCPRYLCQNIVGGYKCGGKLGDPANLFEGRKQFPVNPSDDRCPPGFKAGLNEECEDVDECAMRKDDCNVLSQFCINTRGSFYCQDMVSKHCPPGFKINPTTNKCEDINECEDGQDICRADQICINELGEYDCKPKSRRHQCPEGFRLKRNNSYCEDIDECVEGTHMCDLHQNCLNTNGSHECHCKLGFEVDIATGACMDINECATDQHDCIPDSQRCDNTVGSFLCVRFTSCGTGYILYHATGKCEDMDECALGTHNCARAGPQYQCVNNPGSFRCVKRRASTTSTTTTTLSPEYFYEYYDSDEETESPNNTTPNVETSTNKTEPVNQNTQSSPIPVTTTGVPQPEINIYKEADDKLNSIDSTIPTEKQEKPEFNEPLPNLLPTEIIPDIDSRFNTETSSQSNINSLSYPENTPSQNPPVENTPTSVVPDQSLYYPKQATDQTSYNPYIPIQPTSPRSDPLPSDPSYEINQDIPKVADPDILAVNNENQFNQTIYYDPREPPRESETNVNNNEEPIRLDAPKSTETTFVPIPDNDKTTPKLVSVHVGQKTATVEAEKNPDGSVVLDTNNVPKNEWTEIKEKPKVKCPNGFEPDSYGACVDINECIDNRHSCSGLSESCRNTIGGYVCECAFGFHRDPATRVCNLIVTSSTATPTPPAEQTSKSYFWGYPEFRATTTRPFRPRQLCDVGFHMNSQTGICEDLNECTNGQANCAAVEICVNTVGGYRCECPPHWHLDAVRHSCVPDSVGNRFPDGYGNQPEYPAPDDQVVIKAPANPQYLEPDVTNLGNDRNVIKCPWGYKLGLDNTCEDIDECRTGEAQCGSIQLCTNLPGGYTCSCPAGHKLVGDHQCEDIDECRLPGEICSQHADCVNTIGSYQCQCHSGFRAAPANDKVCVDVDECTEARPGSLCQQRCNNVWGGYRCTCYKGYRLSSDNRTCADIDECSEYKSKILCAGRCVNEPGSFRCTCPKGYRLSEDKRSCIDIDECETGEAPCAHGSGGDVCLNTRGAYRCYRVHCPPGYRLEKRHRCSKIEQVCPAGDWDCAHQPSRYSFHFITFASNLYIPSKVDLFTMKGPSWTYAKMKFDLRLVDITGPPNVKKADMNSFLLSQSGHQAVVSLVESLQGPQSMELQLSMQLYNYDQFGGIAVARLFIHVSEYEF